MNAMVTVAVVIVVVGGITSPLGTSRLFDDRQNCNAHGGVSDNGPGHADTSTWRAANVDTGESPVTQSTIEQVTTDPRPEFVDLDANALRSPSSLSTIDPDVAQTLSHGLGIDPEVWRNIITQATIDPEVWRNIITRATIDPDVLQSLTSRVTIDPEVWRNVIARAIGEGVQRNLSTRRTTVDSDASSPRVAAEESEKSANDEPETFRTKRAARPFDLNRNVAEQASWFPGPSRQPRRGASSEPHDRSRLTAIS